MNAPELSLRSLRVLRGARVILDIGAARFEGGALNVITGANGAGKTTLLLASAGLIDLAAGEVRLDGQRFHQGRAPAPRMLRCRTASSFQEPFLFSGTVRHNLELGLRWRGVPRRMRAQRLQRAAAALDLERLLPRPASELSGGERKRVDLARALATDAEVLFLDEPTLALDVESQERLLGLLRSLAERKASTILLATHDSAWLADIPRNAYRISEGSLSQVS